MPLYLEDEEIEYFVHLPISTALKAIKYEIGERPVSPSLALSMIKKHLQPLIPVEHQDVLEKLTIVSWERLHWTYAKLVFRSGKPTGQLTDVALAVHYINRHTTQPPREFPMETPIEVTNFLQLCVLSQVEVKHLRYADDGSFDVFRACKYCWRQPSPGRFVCAAHTASNKHNFLDVLRATTDKQLSSAAYYKEGKRQKPLYDKILNKTLSKEMWDFHESSFTDNTLIPSSDIWGWLTQRRPLVSQILIEENLSVSDEHIIENLVLILHNTNGLSFSQQQPFLSANNLIQEHPQLIWPMLLRAESWLAARQEFSGNWGGNRKNSYTKKDSS